MFFIFDILSLEMKCFDFFFWYSGAESRFSSFNWVNELMSQCFDFWNWNWNVFFFSPLSQGFYWATFWVAELFVYNSLSISGFLKHSSATCLRYLPTGWKCSSCERYDQHFISPYTNIAQSNIKVVMKKEIIFVQWVLDFKQILIIRLW